MWNLFKLFTFISERKSSQLRMVLEGFHTNDIFAGEPDNGQIVLLDEPDLRRLLTRFLVDFADNVLERHFFDDGLQMQDKLFARTNDTFVIKNSNLKIKKKKLNLNFPARKVFIYLNFRAK